MFPTTSHPGDNFSHSPPTLDEDECLPYSNSARPQFETQEQFPPAWFDNSKSASNTDQTTFPNGADLGRHFYTEYHPFGGTQYENTGMNCIVPDDTVPMHETQLGHKRFIGAEPNPGSREDAMTRVVSPEQYTSGIASPSTHSSYLEPSALGDNL